MTKPNPIEEIITGVLCDPRFEEHKAEDLSFQILAALDNAGYVVVPRWQPPALPLLNTTDDPDIDGGPFPPQQETVA